MFNVPAFKKSLDRHSSKTSTVINKTPRFCNVTEFMSTQKAHPLTGEILTITRERKIGRRGASGGLGIRRSIQLSYEGDGATNKYRDYYLIALPLICAKCRAHSGITVIFQCILPPHSPPPCKYRNLTTPALTYRVGKTMIF